MCVFFTLLLGRPDRGRTNRPPDDSVTLDVSLTLLEPLFAHLSGEDSTRFLLELLRIGQAHMWASPGVVFSATVLPLPCLLLGPTLAPLSGDSAGRMPYR